MIKQLICWLKKPHIHNYVDNYQIDFLDTVTRLQVTTYCSKCLRPYFRKWYRRGKEGNLILTNTDCLSWSKEKFKPTNINDFIVPKGRWEL